MNNSLYEEYMRSVLGYEPLENRNTYDYMANIEGFSNIQNEELENCYPEIYKLIYPMVQKRCMQASGQITREMIEQMTDEIYFAIEDNEDDENRGKETISTTEKTEDRQIGVRNRTLNDLIRILLLRELLGRPGGPGRPPRPPMRPPIRPPMRPTPYPQRPGMRPFNRSVYENFENEYDMYEY